MNKKIKIKIYLAVALGPSALTETLEVNADDLLTGTMTARIFTSLR